MVSEGMSLTCLSHKHTKGRAIFTVRDMSETLGGELERKELTGEN